ncbi:MAG: dihydroorotase, partial [Planctomycetota bacterium]
ATIMQHCEEPALSGGCMNGGDVSTELGLPGVPSEAEELMIARDVLLNRRIGCRYHVQHISSAWSVELVRRAKADGLPVTTEAAPHHLLLTDEACRGYDANYKMNPPLRTQEDVDAVIAGVVDGTIELLATDHAPHMAEDKNVPVPEAAFGILGLECAFGLYKKALVDPGHISAMKMIEMMTLAASKIVDLPDGRGTLAQGSVADVTIIDPNLPWTVDVNEFKSKSRNCPFHGWNLTGRPIRTIVAGKTCWTLAS